MLIIDIDLDKFDSDNGDENQTTIKVSPDLIIHVDPSQLFKNMIENLPEDDTSSIDAWIDWLKLQY